MAKLEPFEVTKSQSVILLVFTSIVTVIIASDVNAVNSTTEIWPPTLIAVKVGRAERKKFLYIGSGE